jgi:membrane protein YdbS with pleckstrin-like domain
MSKTEISVWTGHPSQWVNLPKFLFWGAIALAGVALSFLLTAVLVVVPVCMAFALWHYLVVQNQVFELTSERLKMHSGVLNKHLSELELYRVTDTQFEQPFLLRLVGLAHVHILSADKTTPSVTLTAIPEAREVREQLRDLVEVRRTEKSVRVSEIE